VRNGRKKWRDRLGLSCIYMEPEGLLVESSDQQRLYVLTSKNETLYVKTMFSV